MDKTKRIAAIILGAGLSTRMGCQKLLLPWGKTSVIGNIISVLSSNQIHEIILVIHPDQDQLKNHIQDLSRKFPVKFTINELFKPDDMLTSIQFGLKAVQSSPTGVLVALGDQPQIDGEIISKIIFTHQHSATSIVIPSYSMRRGHPWLIPSPLIPRILELKSPLTARDFLEQHKKDIKYVIVDNDSILRDIDTPDEYLSLLPKSG